MTPFRKNLAFAGAVAAWVLAVGTGSAVLLNYSQTPGKLGTEVPDWPKDAAVPHSPGKASLLVFLHPDCPCSSATVSELSRVLTYKGRPTEVTVCFLHPDGWSDEEVKGRLWNSVERLPGVKLVHDRNGAIAQAFGAETSGTTVFYDERGKLQFRGGITQSRGHEGANANEDALVAQLLNETSKNTQTNVYGCSLF